MLPGLGNFVVDCHIKSKSSSSVFANVAKKQSNVGISGLFINFVVYNFRILVRYIYFESSKRLETLKKLCFKNSLKIGS